ncbi:hypothetical protein BH23BAC1_BH23BAC1_28110 [soil metagenome]
MKVVILLFLLFFDPSTNTAKNSADSLTHLLDNSSKEDKLNILNKLTYNFRIDNPNQAVLYGEQYLNLAIELGNKREELKALNHLGIIFYHLGYYETTLDYFVKVLETAELLNDEHELARILNNLGNLYDEIGDKERAIEYYEKSLELKNKFDDLRGKANTLNNLGYVYNEIGETDRAQYFFKQALDLDENIENVEGIFVSLNNLGLCYLKKELYDSALHFMGKATSLVDQINSIYDKGGLHINYGKIYLNKGDLSEALVFYNKGLDLAQSIKARTLIKDCFKGLAEVYAGLKENDIALDFFRKFTLINDSIFNEGNSRKIANIESDYRMQKREKEIELLKKEAEIQNLILLKNKQISYFLYGCLFLVIGLIVVLYQKYQFKAKANNQLQNQNDIIANKNLNIIDSIHYARGIQEAIMPEKNILNKVFQDYFIFCKPRDIVNGDFYWFADKGEYFVMAVVDCTGHGVPGAFMNVIGNSLLNQIVLEKEIIEPAKILGEINIGVLNTLHQETLEENNNDGMDIGVILYHKSSGKLIFSGARHSLYLFQNGTLTIIKGSNYSIGGIYNNSDKFFKEHQFLLNENDTFYLFTDGIKDQFGEVSNKKFMGRRLKNLLTSMQPYNMEQQYSIVEELLNKWKGSLEQTDDILIIGIKI